MAKEKPETKPKDEKPVETKPAATKPEEPKPEAKDETSSRKTIMPQPRSQANAAPFSDPDVSDIPPVAKGARCVVINPHPRCFTLPGLDPIKPGRNTRDTEAVTKALRNKHARSLGLIVQELGDPEKMSELDAISAIANTYEVGDLKDQKITEKRPAVLAAIDKQLELICPSKEKLEKES
jgi:hypothetical protein